MTEPEHSILGASGASRWMKCPGSVALTKALGGKEDDETEYSVEGDAAHAVAAEALRTQVDAWELSGRTFHNTVVDRGMVDNVQTYISECNRLDAGGGRWVEHRITSRLHAELYGTLDFAALSAVGAVLAIRDLKYGVGIVVEVKDNPQLKYYAFGLLQSSDLFEGVRYVDIGIVQPRAPHAGGPVRTQQYRAEEIHEWGHDVLIPAMHRAEMDSELDPGEHCRFCPARFVCPVLQGLFQAAATTPPTSVRHLSDTMLGLAYKATTPVRIFVKAVEAEAFRRLERGGTVPGLKLVDKRADRVYRDGAEAAFRKQFGNEAYAPLALKSPAQMEKTIPGAAPMVKKWAYTPKTGRTVAPAGDSRVAVKRLTSAETFKGVLEHDDW